MNPKAKAAAKRGEPCVYCDKPVDWLIETGPESPAWASAERKVAHRGCLYRRAYDPTCDLSTAQRRPGRRKGG
ncbi:MAG: hypothetical protein GC157_04630 [Frankiales bacterium]|nr:hypothetical protein [Frankiales bacterium]